MADVTVIGVDPVNGRSKLTYVDHKGPASYTTGGESWPQQSVYGGPNAVGLNDIAWCSGGYTEDGLYFVVPVYGGKGALKGTIKLKWFSIVISGSTFAGTAHTLAGTNTAPNLTIGAGTPATYPVGTAANTGTTTLVATGAVTVTGVAAPIFTGESYTPAGTVSGTTGGTLTEVSAATNLSASYLRLAVLGG
jgi:hypothetical protein